MYLDLPNEAMREYILTSQLESIPNTLTHESVMSIIEWTENNYSWADIIWLIREASMTPLRKMLEKEAEFIKGEEGFYCLFVNKRGLLKFKNIITIFIKVFFSYIKIKMKLL